MTDVTNVTDAPEGLMAAFTSYERALMADDLAQLDRLFAPGEATIRVDPAGTLLGHEVISRFRGGRGGAPRRTVVEVFVQVIDAENALVIAVVEAAQGGRGHQTQLWRRGADGWQITAAHVAPPPPPMDTRIWRVLGDPLVPARATGALDGETVAVKDLFGVAGQRVGAGNPTWLSEAAVEPKSAAVVELLLERGASIRGITRTDELAYSLAGTNAHYGTPPNPRAPHRISGGSSSGSASAVASGHASIGLGTDTGGSIRIPASYQGLFGIRTTHGAVSREGLLPLAPSFDTVGWLTRDAQLLRTVGETLLPRAGSEAGTDLVLAADLVELADGDVASAVEQFATGLPRISLNAPLGEWAGALRIVQAHEAWQAHGGRLEGRLDILGPDVRARFAFASTVTDDAASAARTVVDAARLAIRELVTGRVIVLPAAPTVAPLLGSDLERVRDATLRLTCLAGLGGLPAVIIPRTTAGGLPCGVCLIGPPGADRTLLDLAVSLSDRETR